MTSVRRRLLVWLSASLTFASLVLALCVYAFTLDEMNEVFDEELKQVALTAVAYVQDQHLPTHAASAAAAQDLEDFHFFTQVWSLNGELLFSQNKELAIPFIDQEGLRTVVVKGASWRVYTDRSTHHFTQAIQPMEVRNHLAVEGAIKILLPTLAGIPLVALLLSFSLRQGLSPVVSMAHAIQERAGQSLDPLDSQAAPREIAPLIVAMNELMRRLADMLQRQRRFIADAAHELRTPMTALDLQLQILSSVHDPKARQDALQDMREGLTRASVVVSRLLELSRLEPEVTPVQAEIVDLDDLARSVVADMGPLARSRDIALRILLHDAGGDRACTSGSPRELHTLLMMLIDNALTYTPSGGSVTVEVIGAVGAGRVAIEVSDTGPGLPFEERARVFDRFYRAPGVQAAHEGTHGTGLGLAIAKAIADRHKIQIDLSDAQPGSPAASGLSVRCSFHRAAVRLKAS